MKKIIYIFLTALTIACANSSAPTTENARADEEAIDTAIAIDSVIVAEVVFEDICFLIHRSTYPKISGLADQRFEKKLNEMLRNNFNTFISLAKKEFGGCPDDDDDDYLDVFPAGRSEFSILAKNDSMVSIVQYMISEIGYGGNSWTPSSFTLTADMKNKLIYGRKEFKMGRDKTSYLNAKIKAFFDELFPSEAEDGSIDYPIIKTKSDFDGLNFAVRNDSLMLILEAYPSGHFSYMTYIVPIEKMPRLRDGQQNASPR